MYNEVGYATLIVFCATRPMKLSNMFLRCACRGIFMQDALNMTKRDDAVDVMLTVGIIFVVMGHNYQPPNFFFPAYTFHMPLFFFISGYLFSVKTSFYEKGLFLKKKITTQLIPYFAFEMLFVLATLLLQREDIFTSTNLSPRSLIIEPFYSGHQLPLIIPMWFLLQLFILNLVFQGIYWSNNRAFILFSSIPVVAIGLYMAKIGLNGKSGYELLAVRTCIAAIFFQMGIVVAMYKTIFSRTTQNPFVLFLCWMIVATAPAYLGVVDSVIVFGNVKNTKVLAPILTSAAIILIIFGLSQLAARAIDVKHFFFNIGRNSFWIMSLHLSGFFILNVLFYKLGLIERGKLNDIYFNFNPEKYFVLYLSFGLVFPLVIAQLLRNLRKS